MIAIVTNNSRFALEQIRDRVADFSIATMFGLFKNGDKFKIIVLETQHDADRQRGLEFTRFEQYGAPNPDALIRFLPLVRR